MINNLDLEKQDLELVNLLLLRAKEGKISWTFQGSHAQGQVPGGLGLVISFPKPDILQNERWRQLIVIISGTKVLDLAHPNDPVGRQAADRVAAYQVESAVSELSNVVLGIYKEQTYGKAINVLKNL